MRGNRSAGCPAWPPRLLSLAQNRCRLDSATNLDTTNEEGIGIIKLRKAGLFAAAGTLTVTLLAAGALAAPLSASAAPAPPGAVAPATSGTFTNHASLTGAGIYECPSTTCRLLGWVYPDDPVINYCYVMGQQVEGNPYWDFVYNTRTSVSGWTNESWLQDKTPQNKHC
jgi:hypothetical protein